jgi:hypothetical protein
VPTVDQTILQLEQYFKFIQTAQTQLAELRPEHYFDVASYEEERRRLQQDIREYRKKQVAALEMLERYPQRHHLRHFEKLSQFHQGGNYDASVFIMTKFPEGAAAEATQLQKVIDALEQGIKARGYVPRIASGPGYHRWLFDNVELFLLGCSHGVAIVEDKYLPELNPNVALEWGWMTGMGRDVLFLREKTFKHDRADWSGLRNAEFEWAYPEAGITAALGNFLPQRAQAAGGHP